VKSIEKRKGKVFNIDRGFDDNLSLLELFIILESELSTKLKFKKIAARKLDQKVFIDDIKEAKDLLSWRTKIASITEIKDILN
jgi:UDP-glucose 4-epimerase